MSSFSGARSKLKNATQDLFRLPGQSIPVDTGSLAPERIVTSAKPVTAAKPVASAQPPEAPPASARKAEASIMFSLEELMKSANSVEQPKADDAPDQLWSMQAATPLFGTANDEALLTTPMKTETGSGMDSMTMPSHPPPGRRWLPMVLAIGGCSLAVAAAAWWALEPAFVDPATAAQVAAAAISDLPASAASPASAVPPAAEVAPAEAPPAAVATGPDVAEPSGEVPLVPSSEATPEVAGATPSAPKGQPSTSQAGTRKKPAAPTSTKSAAFDKAAAKNALNSAASKAAGCRQTGAGGQGKVQLTFAPTGKVTSAQIMAGPSASTAEGKCALRHFRAARIPAFSGAAVTVAKSFKIP